MSGAPPNIYVRPERPPPIKPPFPEDWFPSPEGSPVRPQISRAYGKWNPAMEDSAPEAVAHNTDQQHTARRPLFGDPSSPTKVGPIKTMEHMGAPVEYSGKGTAPHQSAESRSSQNKAGRKGKDNQKEV